jgi:hypothetical protein
MRGSLWLDVQSDKDKAVFNFRVGRETVYIPNRHRYPGERVKVEYLIQRGTMVGYTVQILHASK